MKKRLLAPLLGLLLLGACATDDEPTPVTRPNAGPQDLCYLTEQTISNEAGDTTSTIRYTYNEQNQVVQTDHLNGEVLTEVRTYTYTSGGKLAMERLLTPEGEEVSYTDYSYNPQGRLSRYVVLQRVPGLDVIHRLASFKASYDNLGRLTSATDYLYLNNAEQDNGGITQTYVRDSTVTVTVRGSNRATLYTARIVQNDSIFTPLSAVPVYLHRKPGINYPSLNAITEFNAVANDTVAVNVAYKATYKTNNKGFPESAEITYAGGRVEKRTYTYNCPE